MDTIQFLTRKGATCSDLLGCLYNMKPTEIEVFYRLAKSQQATLDQVAAAVGRDRSTTHRCLSKLVSVGLVYKQVKTLKDGGYYHVYSPVEPSRIKEQARIRVSELSASLQELVESFEADFQRHLGTARGRGL
jgi:predicted transcriptional regulator